ncbi:MAG: ELM1/GtrOC1 family putative glycosyltransferase [Deltaproteobacteria bacterium]
MGDWILFFLFSAASGIVRRVPIGVCLAAARFVGRAYACVPSRSRRRAHAHLKIAFPQEGRAGRARIVRSMFEHFAQNAVDVLAAPALDERLVRDRVQLKGAEAMREALASDKGVLLLGVHAGSWELSNIACAVLFPERRYAMLAQPQKRTRRLDAFLNAMRERKGCHVIRVAELRKMRTHLAQGHVLGMVADHGGRDGLPVAFFGKPANTPVGSLKLAAKLGCRIVLVTCRRLGGPRNELAFAPFEPVASGDETADLRENLRRINSHFEEFIRRHPEEYLWTYRRWKHGPQKDVLVLSDGKAGHLKQAEALCAMLRQAGWDVRSRRVDVRFRSPRRRRMLVLVGRLLGMYPASRLLPFAVTPDTFERLAGVYCDMVISAGSSLAVVNLVCARENEARAVVLMRPGLFAVRQFDLVLMPEHDRPRPAKNVVEIVGALSHVTRENLEADFLDLASAHPSLRSARRGPRIGVFLGGDSKNYALTPSLARFVCEQLERALEASGAELALTTSRRTSAAVAETARSFFGNDPRCRLLVIAAEHNPPGAVGGIFFWSDALVVSGDSISMVSEACASGRPVIVFEPHVKNARNKVQRFLDRLAERHAILRVKPSGLSQALEDVFAGRRASPAQNTQSRVMEALERLF